MWGDWLPRPLNRWKYCENGTRWRSAVLGDELKDHVAALIWSWMNLHPIVDESWKDIIYTGYTHVKGLLHKQVWFRTVCVCQCMSFRVCDLGASGLSSQEIQLQKVATKSWFIANYWAMKPWNGCLLFSTRVFHPPKIFSGTRGRKLMIRSRRWRLRCFFLGFPLLLAGQHVKAMCDFFS